MLIYFIHHLARSIQIDSIMSQIQHETHEVIDDVYRHPANDLEPEDRCPDPPAHAVVLPAASSGYLQAIQPAPLVDAAAAHDLVVRLVRRVGDHVVAGTPIAWAWPRSPDRPPPAPAVLGAALAEAVLVGFERTMVQDVLFGLRRLVDIANRALSPAVNDPYTAIQAVHHLSVLPCVLARRQLGDWLCHDRQGTLRVAIPLPDFAEYLRRSTAQIRRFGGRRASLDPEPDPTPAGCGHQHRQQRAAGALCPSPVAGAGGRQTRNRPARRSASRGGGRRRRAHRPGRRPSPDGRLSTRHG